MKKTALTFVAVAFGTCVAFAQTTPQTEEQKDKTEQTLTIDKMSNKPEEAGKRIIKVEELPAAVQANLKSGEFKDFKLTSVAEIQPEAESAQPAAVKYEVTFLDNAPAAVADPKVIVLFDENGKVLSSRREAANNKQEE